MTSSRFISLFICEVSFDHFCRYYNDRKKFFSNEIYKEWTAQLNERSVNEWLLGYVYWERCSM